MNNNTDLSYLMNMISNMDQKQLSNSINQINQMLRPENKKKLIQALNFRK